MIIIIIEIMKLWNNNNWKNGIKSETCSALSSFPLIFDHIRLYI